LDPTVVDCGIVWTLESITSLLTEYSLLSSSAPSVYFPRLLDCLQPTLRPLSDVAIPFSRFCHFSARAGDDKCIHFAFLFSVATFGDFPSLHFVVSMLLNSITKCSPQNFLRPMVALLAHFAIVPVDFSPSFSSFLFRSFRPHFSVRADWWAGA